MELERAKRVDTSGQCGDTVVLPPTSRDQTRTLTNYRASKFLLLLGMVAGAIYAYSFRYSISPDGISYLDVASAYARGDWATAINGYWSPAYSWILAVALKLFHSNGPTELVALHFVNYLCFVAAFISFSHFWRTLWRHDNDSVRRSVGLAHLSPLTLDIFGYGLFLLLFLPLVGTTTPDVLSSSFIFLISAYMLHPTPSWRNPFWGGVSLGTLCALAYFSKAILLYFGLVSLGFLLFEKRSNRFRVFAISIVTFAVLLAPWALAIHYKFGHWSLGYSGQLNYAWFVDGTETKTYPGPVGAPLPYFPGPRVFQHPDIYQVPAAAYITYLPWYDAALMDSPSRAHFQWHGQWVALQKNVAWFCGWFFGSLGPIVVAILALLFVSGRALIVSGRRYLIVVVPSLLILLMYVLVFVRTPRYIAAPTILLLSAAMASVRLKPKQGRQAAAILAAGLLVFATANASGIVDTVSSSLDRHTNTTVDVAEALERAGVQPNTRVATVGTAVYSYWAKLAHVNVTAEIWDEDAPLFWNADVGKQEAMLCAMSAAGASIVIGRPSGSTEMPGWEALGKTGYWMRRLPAGECAPK